MFRDFITSRFVLRVVTEKGSFKSDVWQQDYSSNILRIRKRQAYKHFMLMPSKEIIIKYRAILNQVFITRWMRTVQFAKSDIDEHDSLEHSNGSNIEISILIHRQRNGSKLRVSMCINYYYYYVHSAKRGLRKVTS